MISTAITELLNIRHPVLLAGMNVAAGPELAAAVTNAGGLGVIGGVTYTPKMLRAKVQELKDELTDKSAPFGIDLLLPAVGEGARKTNYDYTDGALPELIDVVIESGAKLFVSAVGVPPKFAVDKLHDAGILVMNMVGAPKHVEKALNAGVDIICAQGGEGGGHTGDVATSILIPACVDLCRDRTSPLTGKQVPVIAAGGIFDGRGLAMALSLGAEGVWVGTRFVASIEGGAPKRHKDGIVKSGVHDTLRTTIYTGRPMRIISNPYAKNWEEERQQELKQCLESGVIPYTKDIQSMEGQSKKGAAVEGSAEDGGKEQDGNIGAMLAYHPLLSGQVAGVINEVLPARTIVEDMVTQAATILEASAAKVAQPAVARSRM